MHISLRPLLLLLKRAAVGRLMVRRPALEKNAQTRQQQQQQQREQGQQKSLGGFLATAVGTARPQVRLSLATFELPARTSGAAQVAAAAVHPAGRRRLGNALQRLFPLWANATVHKTATSTAVNGGAVGQHGMAVGAILFKQRSGVAAAAAAGTALNTAAARLRAGGFGMSIVNAAARRLPRDANVIQRYHLRVSGPMSAYHQLRMLSWPPLGVYNPKLTMAAATATAGVTGRHAHFSTTPAAKASVVLTTSDPVTQLIGSQGRISVGEAANGAGVPMRGSVASIIRIPAEKALASAGGRSKSPSSGKRRRRGHARRVPMTFETFHVREYPDMIKSVTSVADMSDFYVDDFEPLSPEYSEPETIASASTSGTRIVLAISMEPPALKQSAGGSGSGNVLDMIRQRERRQRGHVAQMTRLLEKIMASNELDCACVAVSETLVNVVFPPGVTLEQAKMFVETLGSDPYSDAFEFIEQQQQQQQQQQQLSEEQSIGSGVTMSVGSSDPEIDYIISQVDHLMSIDLSARL